MLDVRYRSLARVSRLGTALALSLTGAVLALVPTAGASPAHAALTATPSPAPAASGAISGRAASVNGAGLAGICVTATLAGRAVGFTATGAGGRYMFTGLHAGKYMVDFTACNAGRHLFPVWYPDAATQVSARALTVRAHQVTKGANVVMRTIGSTAVPAATTPAHAAPASSRPGRLSPRAGTTGTITGKVVDASDKAIDGICVEATANEGTSGYGYAQTGSNGTYSMADVSAGSYTVEFMSGDGCTSGYLDQWYNNASSQASATPVNVTGGGTTANINAAMTLGGTITGKVTSGSGTPIANVSVEVSDSANGTEQIGYTMSDGTYSVGQLPTGSYIVQFTPEGGNYLTQWYNGKSSAATATPVAVTAPEATTNINAKLVVGGTITGKVTNSAGTAIQGICVEVTSTTGNGSGGYAESGPTGTYQVGGLATGSYTVAFLSCGSVQYLEQWYNGKNSAATANPVAVSAGNKVANINAKMVLGGIISGTVTGSGGPLTGICVTATGGGNEYSTTTNNGAYSIGGLATGSYIVEFSACGQPPQNYLPQWWDNASSEAAADPVAVTAGNKVANINANMHPGGTISGTVTSTTGAPLVGICVVAVPVGTGTGNSATTGAGGVYSIVGLATGAYVVQFSSGSGCGGASYLTQWYKGQTNVNSATQVSVIAGQVRAGVNVSLQLGGSITGKVTNAAGTPEPFICVDALPSNAAPGTGISGGTTSLSNGTYTITGLPTGTYLVEFLLGCGNNGNFAPQYYKGSAIFGSASGVLVTVGQKASNINAALQPGGVITGKVTNQSGKGLSGYCVGASGLDNFFAASTAITGSSGTFTIQGLPTSSYTLEAYNCANATSSYLPQWFRNETSGSKANPLSVVAGKTTAPVVISLTLGGTISGTVTGSTSAAAAASVTTAAAGHSTAPLGDVCVIAYSTPGEAAAGFTSTFSNGTYSIPGLAAGKYAVYFDPSCRETGNNAPQWFNGKSTFATATPVTVSLRKTAGAVNANLGAGGIISGTVLAGSKPVGGVCVDVYGEGSFVTNGFAITSSAGKYSVGGLPTGTYLVVFYPTCAVGSNLALQWYKGQSASSKATAVKVTAGATTSGVNASLVAGGSITGSVSGTGVGKLQGVCVYVQSTLGGGTTLIGQTLVGGSWSVANVPAGTYTVEFTPCGVAGNFLGIYYNNQPVTGHGTVVTVQSGKVTPGINATLPIAGIVSGKVTTSAGAPVAGICVTVWQGKSELASAFTGAGGAYSAYGLASGSYTVLASSACSIEDVGNFTGAWYKNASSQASASPVTVTAGHTSTAVNIPIGVDGTITGTVTAKSGAKLSGICVMAFPATNAPATIAITSSGSYTLEALTPGTYKVEFLEGCGSTGTYATQWYKNAASQGSATSITVASGAAITGVSAALS